MNPAVISTVIAAASFILTIRAAIYLNQRHVNKWTERMDRRLQEMRLGSIESRLDRLEQSVFKPILPGD